MEVKALLGYALTGVVSFIVGLLVHRFRAKPRLAYWNPHTFTFLLPDKTTIYTHSVTIHNNGSETAEKVEVVHRAEPELFAIAPAIPYEAVSLPAGEHMLRFDHLGRGESVTIEYLAQEKPPELLSIRHRDGPAGFQEMELSPATPTWLNVLVLLLAVVGLGILVYWVWRAVF